MLKEGTDASEKPLRIQLLLNAFALDGPGRLVAELVEQWSRTRGITVRVAALSRGGPLKALLAEHGVAADIIGAQGIKAWGIARTWAANLSEDLWPDIFHTHLARPDLVGPFLASRMGRPKLVSTNHGLHAWQQKGRLVGHVYSRLFLLRQHRFHRIVAVSRSVADDLEAAGIHRQRIAMIPNGVNPEKFHPAPASQKMEFRRLLGIEPIEGFLVVLVGNLIPLKGHEFFFRAVPKILEKCPSMRILLVGQGPLDSSLHSLAVELNIERIITQISPLSVLLPKVMASADLLVHPSLTESFGLVAAEAQACGLPVVASRIGGLVEIIRDGETGLLVPPGDSQAIEKAVVNLLSNPEVLRAMGMAGRQRTLQLFDIRRCAADYLELFRRL